MSQTTKREANDVPSGIAMSGGIRKSSRIAAQAKRVGGERVSNIEPTLKSQQKSQGKQIESKLAEVSTSSNVQLPRVLRPRKTQQKPEVATTRRAQAVNEHQVRGKKGRGLYRPSTEANLPSIPLPRKKAPGGARTSLPVVKIPATRDAGTQTPAPAGAPLNERSLRRLELEFEASGSTGPNIHQSGLRDDDMVESQRTPFTSRVKSTNDTVYKPRFDIDLKKNGIFEQDVEEGPQHGLEPKLPHNYNTIRDAIQKDRPHDEPSPEQYKEYMRLVFTPGVEEEQVNNDQARLFFGWPASLKEGHKKCTGTWNDHVAITRKIAEKPFTQTPKPDRAEGVNLECIPQRFCDELGGTVVPSQTTGFPNFIVEFKREVSMFVAHRQNKHAGAVASQAYHEYYTKILEEPEKSWDIARVGSIEFNGDIVVGNFHWLSKGEDDGIEDEPRDYYMARIMTRFTFGLNFDDFKTAWKESRNFRDYFFNEREELLKEFKQDHEARKRDLKAQRELDQETSGTATQLHGASRGKRGRGRPSHHSGIQRKQQKADSSSSKSSDISGSEEDADLQSTERTEPRRSNVRLKRGQERDKPAGTQSKKAKPNTSASKQQHNTKLSQPIGDLGLDA